MNTESAKITQPLFQLAHYLRNLIQNRKFKLFEYQILHVVNLFYRVLYTGRSRKTVFNRISRKNLWFDHDSISGPGSTLSEAKVITSALPKLIETYNIKYILDAGCGDLNWIRTTNTKDVQYTGIDIAEDLINNHNKFYQQENIKFIQADICTSALPSADLLIVRDVLVHLPNKAVIAFIHNLKKSNIRYLLATTFPEHRNINICTGGWRPTNLQAKPFHLIKPLEIINENAPYPLYKDKSLGLWDLNELKLKCH